MNTTEDFNPELSIESLYNPRTSQEDRAYIVSELENYTLEEIAEDTAAPPATLIAIYEFIEDISVEYGGRICERLAANPSCPAPCLEGIFPLWIEALRRGEAMSSEADDIFHLLAANPSTPTGALADIWGKWVSEDYDDARYELIFPLLANHPNRPPEVSQIINALRLSS